MRLIKTNLSYFTFNLLIRYYRSSNVLCLPPVIRFLFQDIHRQRMASIKVRQDIPNRQSFDGRMHRPSAGRRLCRYQRGCRSRQSGFQTRVAVENDGCVLQRSFAKSIGQFNGTRSSVPCGKFGNNVSLIRYFAFTFLSVSSVSNLSAVTLITH